MSDDLISRQRAIEVVANYFDFIQLNGDMCIDSLISLPSKAMWIPVSDRLPEKNGDYLCTIRTYDYYTEDDNGKFVGHNPHYTVLICNFVDGEFPCTKYYQNYNVVAWMSLPLPWED